MALAVFQDVPCDVAEFQGVHEVVIADILPRVGHAGWRLARYKLLAAETSDELGADFLGDAKLGFLILDPVNEKLGLGRVVNEGVEHDAWEVVDHGARDSRAEGGA